MIIDAHVHLWDLTKQSLPWLELNPDFAVFKKNITPIDYIAEVKDNGISKAIYIETDVIPSELGKEIELISNICSDASNPFCAMVIGVDFNQHDFYDYIDLHESNPFVKGVRRSVVMPNQTVPQLYPEETIKSKLDYLGQKNLTVDICFRHDDLTYAVNLARQCPDTCFILDHCGNPLMGISKKNLPIIWLQSIQELGKLENVYCKISGVIDVASQAWQIEDTTTIIDLCLKIFGENRVCFGSNWPVCWLRTNISEWISVVESYVSKYYGNSIKHKFFYGNAFNFYELSSDLVYDK